MFTALSFGNINDKKDGEQNLYRLKLTVFIYLYRNYFTQTLCLASGVVTM